jgi:hypothetical protein
MFSSITNWINATIDYGFTANRSVALTLIQTFQVTLSTPVWSKSLFTSVNSTTLPATQNLTLQFAYAVNVTYVVDLATAIDTQLGYTGPGYTLSLTPALLGSVAAGGSESSFAVSPALNFTFSGALITPSGFSHFATGSVVGPTPPTAIDAAALALPSLALVGSVGALGGSTWVATRRPEEEPLPPLDELIRPYEEAIALTARRPTDLAATPVATFPDLVKIADTLGKPILRPVEGDPGRAAFFVVDGRIAYEYRYPGAGSADLAAGTSRAPEIPASTASLVERLRNDVIRLERMDLDPRSTDVVRRRARRAIDLLSTGDEAGAAYEIGEIERALAAARRAQR